MAARGLPVWLAPAHSTAKHNVIIGRCISLDVVLLQCCPAATMTLPAWAPIDFIAKIRGLYSLFHALALRLMMGPLLGTVKTLLTSNLTVGC